MAKQAKQTGGSTPKAAHPPVEGGEAAVYVKPSAVHPWAGNTKKHPPEQVAKIAASIKRFGFGDALTARRESGELSAGHGRWHAAVLLDMPLIPVRFIDISEDDNHLLSIASNKIGENSGHDNERLADALEGVSFDDAMIVGLEAKELERLLADDEGAQVFETDVSELSPEFWISIRGPLKMQPAALDVLRASLEAVEGLDVQVGTIK